MTVLHLLLLSDPVCESSPGQSKERLANGDPPTISHVICSGSPSYKFRNSMLRNVGMPDGGSNDNNVNCLINHSIDLVFLIIFLIICYSPIILYIISSKC